MPCRHSLGELSTMSILISQARRCGPVPVRFRCVSSCPAGPHNAWPGGPRLPPQRFRIWGEYPSLSSPGSRGVYSSLPPLSPHRGSMESALDALSCTLWVCAAYTFPPSLMGHQMPGDPEAKYTRGRWGFAHAH